MCLKRLGVPGRFGNCPLRAPVAYLFRLRPISIVRGSLVGEMRALTSVSQASKSGLPSFSGGSCGIRKRMGETFSVNGFRSEPLEIFFWGGGPAATTADCKSATMKREGSSPSCPTIFNRVIDLNNSCNPSDQGDCKMFFGTCDEIHKTVFRR